MNKITVNTVILKVIYMHQPRIYSWYPTFDMIPPWKFYIMEIIYCFFALSLHSFFSSSLSSFHNFASCSKSLVFLLHRLPTCVSPPNQVSPLYAVFRVPISVSQGTRVFLVCIASKLLLILFCYFDG